MTESTLTLPSGDWPTLEPGWVWLCGAGPGDPGLMTLHAIHALREADVIVYDALVSKEILSWASPETEMVYAGKRGGKPSAKQADISLQLVDLAKAGKRVLRLKGGDPFVFGRGGEEAQTLIQHGVPVRIIPGISAGIGGLAYAGIPVTHRDVNQAVTFVTGHDKTGAATQLDWAAMGRAGGVLVIYMGMKHAPTIREGLLAAGRPEDEPVAVVSQATTPDQRVIETTLGAMVEDIATAAMEPPAIICIGRAVLMRQVLDWQALMRGEAPRDLDPLKRGKPAQEG
ncbi:uroporphyrinogen-III C-methyltransferase [Celeribacter naphthalenivorans]|uniref:uroporphyrinogen-III C-methyltransferase n=1 Tax=Celeribacter naphthalenivorans TaxID=1614694 RepID=UPI001CFB7784|nr:uroporphyrinogen-III C-methyltransferase [Celeribacter naphthalenivorans]